MAFTGNMPPMNDRLSEQLDKILALADSTHDGEALVAVRKARQIMSRDGISFGDLARAAANGQTPGRPVPRTGMFSFLSSHNDHLESQIVHMRQQLEDLRAQMQTQDLQLDFWRRRATDLEQSSTQATYDAERWKKLARETAEKLWDIGQSIGGEEPPLHNTAIPAAIKK
jgi:hypothetical protein